MPINKNDIEQNLRKYSTLSLDNLYNELKSTPDGLTNRQATQKIEDDGPNSVSTVNKNTTINRLLEAVINPFNIILMIIATITLFSDVVFTDTRDYLTFMIILSMIILSSTISFVQSEKSSKAAEKLSKMISNKADVKRNGEFKEIAMDRLVVGDVIKLAAGDMIPADVRFLSTIDMFIAQATLTGESNPVEKFSDIIGNEEESLTDLSNIGFMGSNVVSGAATAIIVATGNSTYLGSMAKALSGSKSKNSFEQGIDSVSKLLIRFMVIMIPIIIIINGVTKNDWVNSILFAISIAVGLTPEMLPVIMTTTLAKGAVKMSKHKVIVKNIGSIQAFGEMDVLCTDKTGTLTEDRIVLEKYLNIHDEDDLDVLKHAYLNSYFQTGLNNTLDIAIINRADTDKVGKLAKEYTVADEMPYDFNRRRMSVVLHHKADGSRIITKGSVEEVISICKNVRYKGKVMPLDKKAHKEVAAIYERYTSKGIRMLAVAEKETDYDAKKIYSIKDEADMTLVGFVGFLDPPKASAKQAIEALADRGVRTIVLSGDSEGVATTVCNKVGIDTRYTVSGLEVEKMSDDKLKVMVEKCNLFHKLSPAQKERVVRTLQNNKHTVGYLGDGINDALPLKQSDVGISVENAVDIAKETASIILLEKDLLVLKQGVVLGRQTFGNIIKYIKMATSGNFGNMFSVVIASIFLPFLPMLPIHILIQNLLCDLSQTGIPFDNVDKEFIMKPRKWSAKSIKNFMFVLGPISSIFDVLCFVVLFFVIKANTQELAPLFQAGWFVFGTVSQVLIIHMIRTAKRPFVNSRASMPLMISTLVMVVVASLIAFTNIGAAFDMMRLPLAFILWLLVLLAGYSLTVETAKKFYIRRFGSWL